MLMRVLILVLLSSVAHAQQPATDLELALVQQRTIQANDAAIAAAALMAAQRRIEQLEREKAECKAPEKK